MKILRVVAAVLVLLCPAGVRLHAQTVNSSQQVVLQGLRTAGGQGAFRAAAFGPGGNLYLLLDEGDGVRVLETGSAAATVLAQVQLGAAGDSGLALSVDPAGNVYVTGTSTSGSLRGTSGAAFPSPADTSTNSFVAKFDPSLNLAFLSFCGAGRTAAAALAVTADAAFVTGITFSSALPVSASAIGQAPASGSSENGFVERFSATGTLVYATYLTGVNGSTVPAAIAADGSDNAYVAGSTTSTGYPTTAALVPEQFGSPSGFLTKLTPAAEGYVFSTFIPGSGITSLALDAGTSSLLLTGNVSLGQFPVATVAAPLVATTYQTLLRIPEDGQSVSQSTLLLPGAQFYAAADGTGGAWITGALSTPLFPGTTQPDYPAGDSFLLHLNSAGNFDQTLRFGGLPVNNPQYSSLTSSVAAPAVASAGGTVFVPGSITASAASSLLPTQRFDLPLVGVPNAVLPNALHDVLPAPAACTNSSQCSGSGAFLAAVTTSTSGAVLAISADDLPNLTLRNLGSAAATGLAIAVSGYSQSNDCGSTLPPSTACSLALTGSGPGTLTVSAANAATTTVTLPANALTPDAIVLSTNELDFGIVTSADAPALRTIAVTNLSGAAQVFSSAADAAPASVPYLLSQASTDCTPSGQAHSYTLAAGATCHVTLSLGASTSSSNDGAVTAYWKIGPRDLKLTGFTEAAALTLSAAEVDFGTQFTSGGAPHLPRYLYLSNNSTAAIPHAVVGLPAGSAFAVTDECPDQMAPRSVCRIDLTYASTTAPSEDTATLVLDDGLAALLTGKTLQPAGVTGSVANPNLNVSPTSVGFPTAVTVTGLSGGSQTVTIANTGSAALSLTLNLSGDFKLTSNCPGQLPGGASCQALISFAPSQPGVRDGLLSVSGGSGFAPVLVSLSGTGAAILPANNGVLALGTTLVGEPLVGWYKVPTSLPSLTAATNNASFGVALVEDTGSGHGTLPASAFVQSTTGSCVNCWLGVQFLGNSAGSAVATLSLSTVSGGNAYMVGLSATALPVQGLLLTPATEDFGTVAVHSSGAAQALTLVNLLSPAANATITSIQVTGDFAVTSGASGAGACSAAGSLPATASCSIELAFTPAATGLRSGTLTVTTSGGTATAALSGYGTADPGISFQPNVLAFNNGTGASATQRTMQVTNTGGAVLTIGTPTSTDPGFTASTTCATLPPGGTCSVTVQFAAGSSPVTAQLLVPVAATLNGQTSNTTYALSLSGQYTSSEAGLVFTPAQANFGSLAPGAQGPTRLLTLANTTSKTLNVTLVLPRQFALSGSNSCATLAPGASCSAAVMYLPVTSAELTGTILAEATPTDGSPGLQALSYLIGYGGGTGTLHISGNLVPSAPLNFGQVSSGQSSQQVLTLTNTGLGPLTVRRITSEPPFFSSSSCGATLAPNTTCTVTLTYAPVDEVATSTNSPATRTDQGSLVIESDAASSPDALPLQGFAAPVVSTSPASSAVLAVLGVSQGSLSFPNTQVGNVSVGQLLTLTNQGGTTVHVQGLTAPADFTVANRCATLLPGDTCTVTVQFTPGQGSTAALRSGTLEIASDAATSLEFVTLMGTSSAAPLSFSPTTLDFGSVNLGGAGTLGVTVTNTSAAPVTFTSVTAGGDYSVARGTCPLNGTSLAAGVSCTLQVTFTPTAAGTRTGVLSLSSDSTALPLTEALTGVAVAGQLQITPGALPFGSIAVGAPASLTITALNTGTASVTGISSVLGGANAADFAVTVPCPTSMLAPGQGCSITVTFTPAALGARAANLVVSSSDASSPRSIALTGTGAQTGGIMLTVNGGSSATQTATSGSPASYGLAVNAVGGFSGPVALTCAPITPGPYAACSLLPSSLTVAGAAANSTATITTITTVAAARDVGGLAWLLAAPALLLLPKRLRFRSSMALAGLLCFLFLGLAGCGSSPAGTNPNLRRTPSGSYQYQVTATSTSGSQVSSTVTLNLIIP